MLKAQSGIYELDLYLKSGLVNFPSQFIQQSFKHDSSQLKNLLDFEFIYEKK